MDALFKRVLETSDFETICKDKGYAFFTKGDYNLNIFGCRFLLGNDYTVTDLFDDAIVLVYKEGGKYVRKIYECTVDPGSTYMKSPMNSTGTGIIVPGQYRGVLKLGYHKGQYEALVQAKPIKLYRDNNKDLVYDMNPSTIEEGMFGVNIHKAGANSSVIKNWSAACTVFKRESDFNEFMKLCKKSANLYGNSFTYTVFDVNPEFS